MSHSNAPSLKNTLQCVPTSIILCSVSLNDDDDDDEGQNCCLKICLNTYILYIGMYISVYACEKKNLLPYSLLVCLLLLFPFCINTCLRGDELEVKSSFAKKNDRIL